VAEGEGGTAVPVWPLKKKRSESSGQKSAGKNRQAALHLSLGAHPCCSVAASAWRLGCSFIAEALHLNRPIPKADVSPDVLI
jgi:hypothetical protein